jgi:hypothetical protein
MSSRVAHNKKFLRIIFPLWSCFSATLVAFVYGSKIDKENNEDKKPLVPHHFVNLLMSGDLYL